MGQPTTETAFSFGDRIANRRDPLPPMAVEYREPTPAPPPAPQTAVAPPKPAGSTGRDEQPVAPPRAAGVMGRDEQVVAELGQSIARLMLGAMGNLDRRREAENRVWEEALETVRGQIRDLDGLMKDRLDAVFGRLEIQQEEFSTLRSTVENLSGKVETVSGKMGAASAAILSLGQAQDRRRSALERLGQALGALQESLAEDHPVN